MTRQAPIGSGFGSTTTAAEVLEGVDLSGKVAIVTGGYSGIGLATTKALSDAGATVLVPARNREKARDALRGIPRVEQRAMDLLDPASIDAFADAFLSTRRSLDILINNAGIMRTPELQLDRRGCEIQFASNHLGHFQLTLRLWEALKRPGRARVVTLSSIGHRYAGIDFHDLSFRNKPYDKAAAYGQSKTANSLFSVELDQRGASHGIRAFAAHPGAVVTDLVREMSDDELSAYGIRRENGTLKAPATGYKTPEQGAATSMWCATSRQLDGMGGVYCEDCDIAELVPDDSKLLRGVRRWAVDANAAKALWDVSETITGVRLPK